LANAVGLASVRAELDDARVLAATEEVALEETMILVQSESAMFQAAEVAEVSSRRALLAELTAARAELSGMRQEAHEETSALHDALRQAKAERARYAEVQCQLAATTAAADRVRARTSTDLAKARTEMESLRNQERHVEVLWEGRYAEAEAVFAEQADADATQLQAALAAELIESKIAETAREALAETQAAAKWLDLERSTLQGQLSRTLGAEEVAKAALEDTQRACGTLRSELSRERNLEEAARSAAERLRTERDLLSSELAEQLRAHDAATEQGKTAAAVVNDSGFSPRRSCTEPTGGPSSATPLPSLPFQVELLRAAQDYQRQCEQLSKDLASECRAVAAARHEGEEMMSRERALFCAALGESKAVEEELRCECSMLLRRLEDDGSKVGEDIDGATGFHQQFQPKADKLGLQSGGIASAVAVRSRVGPHRMRTATLSSLRGASSSNHRLTKVAALFALGAPLAHWGINHWRLHGAPSAVQDVKVSVASR